VLTWKPDNTFVEIAMPDWWAKALDVVFPPDGDGPRLHARFGTTDGPMIEVWQVRPPGWGYVLTLADTTSNLLLWVEERATYLDFITSRGPAWLGFPALQRQIGRFTRRERAAGGEMWAMLEILKMK
jgi:hypothetical protein